MDTLSLSSLYQDSDFTAVVDGAILTTNVVREVVILPKNIQHWTEEILNDLSRLKWIEIHLPSMVYGGVIYGKPVKKPETVNFNVSIKTLVEKQKIISLKNKDISNFWLKDSGKPIFIKEAGWDLFWFGFKNGHVAFYFSKPD